MSACILVVPKLAPDGHFGHVGRLLGLLVGLDVVLWCLGLECWLCWRLAIRAVIYDQLMNCRLEHNKDTDVEHCLGLF